MTHIAATQPHPSSLDQSILIVEDEEINLEAGRGLLQEIGFHRIHTALSGKEGLKTLRRLGSADFVIVDIYMPDMDGIEFITELAALQFVGKVIMVSGVNLATLEIARQLAVGYGLKVAATLEKPLRREILEPVLTGPSA